MSETVEESKQALWRCTVCHAGLGAAPSDRVGCGCGNRYVLRNGVWDCRQDFAPQAFSVDRSEQLLDLESRHFWFGARDRLMRELLRRFRGRQARRLVDLGCGSGRMVGTLGPEWTLTVGVEGHLQALQRGAARGSGPVLIHADVLDTPLADGQFDCVTAFDVLEHVDPAALLGEAYRLARPGGRLLLSVPAFPLLWSRVDELAGHRCRYRLEQARDELRAAGWRPMGHTHFQFLLFPLFALNRVLHRRAEPGLERRPPGWLNRALGWVNQIEVGLLHRVTLPFGTSLVVWAQKPDAK